MDCNASWISILSMSLNVLFNTQTSMSMSSYHYGLHSIMDCNASWTSRILSSSIKQVASLVNLVLMNSFFEYILKRAKDVLVAHLRIYSFHHRDLHPIYFVNILQCIIQQMNTTWSPINFLVGLLNHLPSTFANMGCIYHHSYNFGGSLLLNSLLRQ